MKQRWLALSALFLAGTLQPGCNCDEPIVIKVAPMLQVQHGDESVETPLCAVADSTECVLDFGESGISLFNYRDVVLANRADVPLTMYEVRIAQDSPQLPELAVDWSSVGRPVLAGKEYVAFKVFWTPTFEMDEGQIIGTIEVITDADNAEEPLNEEECIAANARLGCGLTRIQITGQGVDMGLPEAKIVARVGTNAWDGGPCNFGYVGSNRQASCRVEITNIGERDLLIFGAQLGFNEAPRSECQTCEGQSWCGAEDLSCVPGPFAAEETGEGGVWDERVPCDAENRCEVGQFCAMDVEGSGEGFCSAEAEVPEGRKIFDFIEQPAFSREHPLAISPGTSTTIQLMFQPPALRRYSSRIEFTTNIPESDVIGIGLVGVGHDAPTAVPRVLAVSGGPPNRDNDGVAQVAPADSVTLTSEDSYGANGAAIVAQQWSFSEDPEVGAYRPTDSQLDFVDPEGQTTMLGFLNNINNFIRGVDIIGSYRAALRVRDEHGVWSDWETVDFQNIPGDSIHVEMTWDHPTSDVDLHLIRTGDRAAYTSANDCYYANCKPRGGNPQRSWGPGGFEDDPVLDVDDVNGFGPENINIDQPEDDQSYLVGVHYFRDAPGGVGGVRSTICTIRIYVWERLVFEEVTVLEADEAWWEVAHIEWNSGDVDDGRSAYYDAPPPRQP